MTTVPSRNTDALTVDEILELLSVRRRRYLLAALSNVATPASLPRLADEMTEWEHGVPAEERKQERQQIYMSLYHTHVPKLEDADVVSYTQADDTVEWDENAQIVRPYLEKVMSSSLPSADS